MVVVRHITAGWQRPSPALSPVAIPKCKLVNGITAGFDPHLIEAFAHRVNDWKYRISTSRKRSAATPYVMPADFNCLPTAITAPSTTTPTCMNPRECSRTIACPAADSTPPIAKSNNHATILTDTKSVPAIFPNRTADPTESNPRATLPPVAVRAASTPFGTTAQAATRRESLESPQSSWPIPAAIFASSSSPPFSSRMPSTFASSSDWYLPCATRFLTKSSASTGKFNFLA